MSESDVTFRIATYMKENKISIRQTSIDTDIPEKKLTADYPEKLNATEFLALCSYLGIRPEDLR